MVGIGGLYVMGGGYFPQTIPQVLGAVSVLLASVNVAGGFVITKRMLDMFKRESTTTSTYSLLFPYLLNLPILQVPRTLPSMPGSTVSRLLYILADSCGPRAPGWLVLFKLATLLAAYFASVRLIA